MQEGGDLRTNIVTSWAPVGASNVLLSQNRIRESVDFNKASFQQPAVILYSIILILLISKSELSFKRDWDEISGTSRITRIFFKTSHSGLLHAAATQCFWSGINSKLTNKWHFNQIKTTVLRFYNIQKQLKDCNLRTRIPSTFWILFS